MPPIERLHVMLEKTFASSSPPQKGINSRQPIQALANQPNQLHKQAGPPHHSAAAHHSRLQQRFPPTSASAAPRVAGPRAAAPRRSLELGNLEMPKERQGGAQSVV